MSDPFLREQLRKGLFDDPWHGPSIADLLLDVTAEEAAAHPVPGAHSIWELVLHMTAWQGEVRQRLLGKEPGLPDVGDWPDVGDPSDIAWERAREQLAASMNELLESLTTLSREDLERPGGSINDRLGVTHRAMINGLVQHAAYHGGQIALLRKALRAGR
ncbi:MAG TPA: DinB family protein [Thermoanaerobaculia bacterium]